MRGGRREKTPVVDLLPGDIHPLEEEDHLLLVVAGAITLVEGQSVPSKGAWAYVLTPTGAFWTNLSDESDRLTYCGPFATDDSRLVSRFNERREGYLNRTADTEADSDGI